MDSVETSPPGRQAPKRPSRRQLEELRALVEDSSRRLAAMPDGAMARLLPALLQAQRELARDLGAWLARAPSGAERFTAQKYRALLVQLQGAFETIRALAPEVAKTLSDGHAEMGAFALESMKREYARMLEVFGGSRLGPGRLDLDTARVLSESQSLLVPRFRTSAQRYAGQVQADIQRELVVGVLRGETLTELTDRLVRLGGPRGVVALRGVTGEPGAVTEAISEGLFKRYRYWGHRLVRTELQSAANTVLDEGIRQLHARDPGIQRRWDASIDGRVCAVCRWLHNATAPVDAAFPGGYATAPAHPNCRCRVGAWRRGWERYLAWMDAE